MKTITKATPNGLRKVDYPIFDTDQARRLFDSLDVSEVTRSDYKARIKDFLDFVATRGIYSNILLDYKTDLTNRITVTGALSVSTKNKYLATARAYLKICSKLFDLPDYSKDVKGFSQNKKHKKAGLTEAEIRHINNAAFGSITGVKQTRARALFCLLTFQGLRQIEIRRLRISDIDLKAATAFIQGKGSDDKEMIYLHPETVKAITIYLADLKARGGNSNGYLFQSIGNRKSAALISTMTLQREIKAIFKLCGIDGKTVHGFRHYYVTRLLKSFDIHTVRKFSRHKNLEMLIVYDDEISTKGKAAEIFSALSL